MNDSGLSEAEIKQLSLAVDEQLQEVQRSERSAVAKGVGEDELARKRMALYRQLELIEQQAEEPADSFLRKLGRTTRRDICEEDGLLNQQWQRFQDLSRPDTIACVATALGFLGIASTTVVAIAAPISVIILHLGLRTFCEEYGGGKDGDAAEPDA